MLIDHLAWCTSVTNEHVRAHTFTYLLGYVEGFEYLVLFILS